MPIEKHAAFAQAWSDMPIDAFRANQVFTASMLPFIFTPFSYNRATASATAHVHNAAIGVLGKGLAPIHRKAISNARRLAKTRPKTLIVGTTMPWIRKSL